MRSPCIFIFFVICILETITSCVIRPSSQAAGKTEATEEGRRISGTVDFDSNFRFQFVAADGLIYLRRMIHPGGADRHEWLATITEDESKFLEAILRLRGETLPVNPPGPMAALKLQNLADDSRVETRFFGWDSSHTFRDRLMRILQAGCANGKKLSFWPKEIEQARNEP